MYRKRRSKPFSLAEGPQILTEFLYPIMDGDLAFRQEGLKRELGDFRDTACLRESEPVLLEQHQREFLLQFRSTDVSGREYLI